MRTRAVGGKVGLVGIPIDQTGLLELVNDLASHNLSRILRVLPAVDLLHESEDLVDRARRLGRLAPSVVFGEPGESQEGQTRDVVPLGWRQPKLLQDVTRFVNLAHATRVLAPSSVRREG